MALSKQQTAVLRALDRSEAPLTTHAVGDVLRREFTDSPHGYYNKANKMLARLEQRELVTRTPKVGQRVASWTLTPLGRKELEASPHAVRS
jgi:DNA-binding MarR family transcriptional regulator